MATSKMKNPGTLTVLLELVAGLFCIFFLPFFKMKVPININTYIFLGLSIIFYSIQDRLSTISRSGIEASSYSIIKQLSTVFMIILGIIIFKEKLIWNKIIGSILIISSNIFVFYKKNSFKLDKYIILGIIANLCLTIALFLDVNISKEFNLAIYVLITLIFPAILICFFEKIDLKQVELEYKNSNKTIIFLTSISWTIMMLVKLKSYQLGKITLIAPLCSLTIILNVIFEYFLLKEKNNLIKKIIASLIIVIGIFMIKS